MYGNFYYLTRVILLINTARCVHKGLLILRTLPLINVAFTMAGAGQRTSLFGLRACLQRLKLHTIACHKALLLYGHTVAAFTMAEILLSLTIIGVVAAITLPSLTGNINERTWNTQRKALFARFSQAIALMPSLNGFGTLDATDSHNVAETFITSGLSKVLKINNICNHSNLSDCGLPNKFIKINGNVFSPIPTTLEGLNSRMTNMSVDNAGTPYSYAQIDTKAAAFETANGESILTFYNPNCRADLASRSYTDYSQPKVCANFIYDLNGKKGPNTVGKDMGFITVLYPSDSVVVAPIPHVSAGQNGLSVPEGARYCAALDDGYRLPNKDEAASLFVNQELLGNIDNSTTTWLLTSSKGMLNNSKIAVWTQSVWTGNRILNEGLDTAGVAWATVRCVKR